VNKQINNVQECIISQMSRALTCSRQENTVYTVGNAVDTTGQLSALADVFSLFR